MNSGAGLIDWEMFCRFERKIKMKRIHQVKDKYDWYFDKFYKYQYKR